MNWIRLSLLICCLLFSSTFSTFAEEVTVVYPDVKAPYDTIFQKINLGIKKEFDGDIKLIKIPSKFSAEEVANQIKTDKVIALGRRGLIVAKEIYQKKPVVVGALPITPNGIAGVSLMASPDILFGSLNELAPNVKKVTVLYTQASAWIISSAEEKAKKFGLELVSIPVDDIKAAVMTYNDIFEQDDPEENAIWLPLDPVTANDKVVVPAILKKAWENKMVVFSSKPTHAKRGALFSAIPDNEMLGKQLAKLVNTFDYQKRPSTVAPLDQIKLAVNLRTAAHLGYNYDSKEKSKFALTFPN